MGGEIVPIEVDARRKLAALKASFTARARPVRVVRKRDFWLQRAIDRALRVLTVGAMDSYLTNYVTTIGHTIYVPDDFEQWPAVRACEVLRHEAVHVAQFERYGLVGMTLLYLLVPLPIGLAYARARLEWEGYRETLRAVAELEGMAAARNPALHREIVRRFTGPDYGWMWPFPTHIARWIAEALDEIAAEQNVSRTLH